MPDAPSRVERVLNLLALLLDTRRALTREEIVHDVAGYPPQITAYRRAFERDKETLRGMGVPLTTEPIGDGSELGYRVRPEDYYLPDLGLGVEEAAALRVAVSAVSLGSHAGEGALLKLGGLADHRDAMLSELGSDAVIEEDRDDDGAVVEMTVTNRAAFRTFLLGFLEHAEVLDPPDIRADFVTWLERAASGAASSGGS